MAEAEQEGSPTRLGTPGLRTLAVDSPPPGWGQPPPGPWTAPGTNRVTVVDPTAGEGLAAALAPGDVPLDRQLQAGGAPASRGSAGMWLLFGALGFLVGQVLGAIFAVVAAAADGKLHNLNAIASLSEPPTWYIVSTLVGLWAGFLAGPWLASTVRGTRSLVRDLGLRFKWIDLVGITIGIGGQFVVAAIYIPISAST